jgi:uroporphyrinogen decarboxylase
MSDLFLRACRRESIERPPVWMMRQAGRYLPEYRAVRAKSDFLSMCRTPELAVEVTLQPVDILSVDAAIIFSDILVIPEAMGMHLIMDEGKGPQFPSPLRSAADVRGLRDVDPNTDLRYVMDALTLARRELNGRVPLIGFAGAPWTLASYMVEGKGTKQFAVAKKLLYEDPATAHLLLGRIAVAVGHYMKAQIAAGAQALQLFDSWAGALGPELFREFGLRYLAQVAEIARTAGVPFIVFAPGAGWAFDEIARETKADVVGVDWHMDAAAARAAADRCGVAVQGNLDPCALYGSPESIRARTQQMLRTVGGRGHIANLGHGILPDVPVEHARAFVDTVRNWSNRAEFGAVSGATTT